MRGCRTTIAGLSGPQTAIRHATGIDYAQSEPTPWPKVTAPVAWLMYGPGGVGVYHLVEPSAEEKSRFNYARYAPA